MKTIYQHVNRTLLFLVIIIYFIFLLTFLVLTSYSEHKRINKSLVANNESALLMLEKQVILYNNYDNIVNSIIGSVHENRDEHLDRIIENSAYFKNLVLIENNHIDYQYTTLLNEIDFSLLEAASMTPIISDALLANETVIINKNENNIYLLYIINDALFNDVKYNSKLVNKCQISNNQFNINSVFKQQEFNYCRKINIYNHNYYLSTQLIRTEIYLAVINNNLIPIIFSLIILGLVIFILWLKVKLIVKRPFKHFTHAVEQENDLNFYENIDETNFLYDEFAKIFKVFKKISFLSKSKYENIIQNLQLELNEANKSNKSKLLFLANMSHDMRTPLNSIIGYTQLTQKIGLNNTSKVEEYFDCIQNSSEILLQKVNDILDYAKIDSKQFTLKTQPTKIINLIKEVYDLLSIQAAKKNIEFVYNVGQQIPQYLDIDPTRLKQVLINLCSNAIKFTDEGVVKLEVKVFGYTNEAIFLEYIITDSGIGIPNDQIDAIFVPFVQVTSQSSLYRGTGLGLSIARDLIRLMDGDITVTSKENVGTIFSFITKFKISRTIPENLHLEHDVSNETFINIIKDKSILVCEDNLINQVFIKEIFTVFDKHDITIASDGIEAVNMCKDHLYDIILMDIQMPNLNGIEATKIIKSLIQYQEIPIIALTANAFSDQIKEYLLIGMKDYLSKPIDIKHFKNILAKHLSR